MTGLSRAGYYRWRVPPPATPVAMELRSQVQRTALEWPAYGYRRITAELQRRGFDVNHKRVLRLMREDNLLCLRRRSFMVTTDSCHNLPVYPNLAREMRPAAVNQLWVADIHLHPVTNRVRVFGCGAGRVLAACDWLGFGPDAGGEVGGLGSTHGDRSAKASSGTGAPLRSWCAVRFDRVHQSAQTISGENQYEPPPHPL
jgi:hypothetical protein